MEREGEIGKGREGDTVTFVYNRLEKGGGEAYHAPLIEKSLLERGVAVVERTKSFTQPGVIATCDVNVCATTIGAIRRSA